ncbi:MAG: DUF2959 domain-containing protein [Phycisphaerales bacterium]
MSNPTRLRRLILSIFVISALVASGCKSMYYGAMEAVGVHKREILVDRVEEARDEQEEAKDQFRTALVAFTEVTEFEGGELEAAYKRLNAEYERAESEAEDVRDRIDSIESVAEALFDEWERELDEYESDKLRRSSERSLEATRDRYESLIRAMRRAEEKMDPVLAAFRDQTLFLKHNLNARAIASLEGDLDELEDDIDALIREMEASIAEANEFIDAMGVAPVDDEDES